MHKLRCEAVDPMRQRGFGNAAVCMPDIKAKPEARIVHALGNRRCDFRFGFHNVFKQKINVVRCVFQKITPKLNGFVNEILFVVNKRYESRVKHNSFCSDNIRRKQCLVKSPPNNVANKRIYCTRRKLRKRGVKQQPQTAARFGSKLRNAAKMRRTVRIHVRRIAEFCNFKPQRVFPRSSSAVLRNG